MGLNPRCNASNVKNLALGFRLIRERLIDFVIMFTSQIMTYETKKIAFHIIHVKVNGDSQCLRTLPMNVAIESTLCDCERSSCKDCIWLTMRRKHNQI